MLTYNLVFSVFIAGEVLKKALATYGGEPALKQEIISRNKADLIYGALDAFPKVYKVTRILPDTYEKLLTNRSFPTNRRVQG